MEVIRHCVKDWKRYTRWYHQTLKNNTIHRKQGMCSKNAPPPHCTQPKLWSNSNLYNS